MKNYKTIFFIRSHFVNKMSAYIQINIIINICAFEIAVFGDLVVNKRAFLLSVCRF